MPKLAHKVDLQDVPFKGRARFLCGMSVHGTEDHIALANANVTCPRCKELLDPDAPRPARKKRVSARDSRPRLPVGSTETD